MEVPETYEKTVIGDPVETAVYDGRVTVRNDVRADFLIRELTRTTITTTVTTHDTETDDQIGDPVVSAASSEMPTGRKQRFPFDIRNVQDADIRNERLLELRDRIVAWIASAAQDDTIEDFLQGKLDGFLNTF